MDRAALQQQIEPHSENLLPNSQSVTGPIRTMQGSAKDPRVARPSQDTVQQHVQGNGDATATPQSLLKPAQPDEAYDPAAEVPQQQTSDQTAQQQILPEQTPDSSNLGGIATHAAYQQVQPPHQQQKLQTTNQPEQQPAAGGGGANNNAGSKIFVGGLSWETDEDSLKRYFQQYGEVLDCVIMRDRHTGHPRGFGFVTFADDAVAGRAASRRHDLDGRQVEAKRAVPRNEFHSQGGGNAGGAAGAVGGQGYGTGARGGQGGRYGGDAGAAGYGAAGSSVSGNNSRNHHSTKCKVFVGGLPSSCGVDEFRSFFSTFGEVVDAQVMIDHNTGNSRGFGFVTFASEATVEAVVGPGKSNTRHEIMGKSVEVKRAEPKGANTDRRNRDSYNTSGAGMRNVGGTNSSNLGANADAGSNAAAQQAAAYYSNYSGASLAEQYGAYYNNPQWQQYYAAMGYNFNAYPQGYNPYQYLQAYMSNAANLANGSNAASGMGADATGSAAPGSGAEVPGYDANNNNAMRALRYGAGGDGSAGGAAGGAASAIGGGDAGGGGAGGTSGTGGASRRASRRDDRYHPYR